MPNLNEVKDHGIQLGFIERIPQRTDAKETPFFLLTVFTVIFTAAMLLFFTYNSSEENKRVPASLSNLVTQLQNSIDEITFIAEIEGLSLPLPLEKIKAFELGPFSSNQFISPRLGCYIHQIDSHQLQLLYQSKEWRVSWRTDGHDDHHGDAIQELCFDDTHWQLISTHSTSQQ